MRQSFVTRDALRRAESVWRPVVCTAAILAVANCSTVLAQRAAAQQELRAPQAVDATAQQPAASVNGPAPDFVRDVKPILAAHCIKCHGREKHEAGLRLDVGGGLLDGGDAGPAVSTEKPAESLLLRAVIGVDDDVSEMPPEGPKLSAEQIDVLRRWIAAGAVVPANERVVRVETDHWAFQELVRPTLPGVENASWPRTPIDLFILARLEREGVAPATEADRATLIRRVCLDLIGLPPTREEVAEFVADDRPDAYERLVDRLLASPAYGERWGRHWLDAARYADSNGFTRDFAREIWRYRDWVIGAVNADLPFDLFTRDQFAGDLLPDATLDQQIATGFHRNTLINEEGGTDPEQFRVDAVADRVHTVGSVYLGLTLECARCHGHKYDPITQRDYYRMFALLNQCDEPKIDAPYDWQISSGLVAERDAIRAKIAELEQSAREEKDKLKDVQLAWEKTVTPELRATFAGPVQSALMVPYAERNEEQLRLVYDVFAETDVAREAFPPIEEINRLRKIEPRIPTTMVLAPRDEPRVTFVHLRGDFLSHGPRVEPGTPAVLPPLPEKASAPTRLDFARWLTSVDNPLTPRVIVNRDWQQFFGRGIVETENDFGTQGSPPSHPELLDWLAIEFVEHGWSRKAMHRGIVLSAVYRQSSRRRPELDDVDPRNILLARQSRIRLDAELIRDSALAASGLLTHKLGGPSVHPPQPDGVFDFTQDKKPWNVEPGEDRYRRGMYTFFWRSSPYPALILFDAPNGNVSCTRRVRSNTPLQSLTLANDEQFIECARGLAVETLNASQDDGSRARFMFTRCFARTPADREAARLLSLVEQQRERFTSDVTGARQFLGESPANNDEAGSNETTPSNESPASAAVTIDVAATDANAAAMSDEAAIALAAWAAAARVLMNVDEFITRE